MEALVFGLDASIALNKKQERIVPEPAEFQSFTVIHRVVSSLYVSNQ
jgi:hypothetical protein